MERKVLAKLYVSEEESDDCGILDYVDRELGWVEESGISHGDMVILDCDSESTHERYLNYLSDWIFNHHGDEFQGCSPASYEKWLDNEDNKNEEDQ